jgi:hypothetical protein
MLVDDPIRRRMMSLSDEELERVVGVEADDWQPDAIDVAREERVRRGLGGPAPFREPAYRRSGPPAPLADRRRPNVSKGVPLFILAIIVARVLLYLAR